MTDNYYIPAASTADNATTANIADSLLPPRAVTQLAEACSARGLFGTLAALNQACKQYRDLSNKVISKYLGIKVARTKSAEEQLAVMRAMLEGRAGSGTEFLVLKLDEALPPSTFTKMASTAASYFPTTLKAVVAWGGKGCKANLVHIFVASLYSAGTSDLDQLQRAFYMLDVEGDKGIEPMEVSELHLLISIGGTRPRTTAAQPTAGHPRPTYSKVSFRPLDQRAREYPADMIVDFAGPMAEHLRHSRPEVVLKNFWTWGEGAVKKTEVLMKHIVAVDPSLTFPQFSFMVDCPGLIRRHRMETMPSKPALAAAVGAMCKPEWRRGTKAAKRVLGVRPLGIHFKVTQVTTKVDLKKKKGRCKIMRTYQKDEVSVVWK